MGPSLPIKKPYVPMDVELADPDQDGEQPAEAVLLLEHAPAK
jgi:hypothetical protein